MKKMRRFLPLCLLLLALAGCGAPAPGEYDDLSFLTEELQTLYQKGSAVSLALESPGSSELFTDSRTSAELDGRTYFRSGRCTYGEWETYVLSLFTPECYAEKNVQEITRWDAATQTAEVLYTVPVFRDVNGDLYLLDGDFGGDITLLCDTAERGLPAYRLTAYSADRIEFEALRYYTDLDHALQQNAPVVTTKAFCCVLVKTDAGWRISTLQNPR